MDIAQDSHLDIAISYTTHAWSVVPLHSATDGTCSCGNPDCGSPGKHPRIKGGYKHASTDPDRIRAWWAKWPNANIGIRTGIASGLVVLDVDPRNGGDESLAALVEEHGPLPATLEVETGGGGSHYYFAYPEGLQEPLKKVIAPGLDLLADGAYVVAPPSTHKSGGAYRWSEVTMSDMTPAPMPDWLIELATTPPTPKVRSLDELLDEVGTIEPDATAGDIEAWLREAVRIAISPDVAGREVLFRQLAVGRLSLVQTIKRSAAKVFGEALDSARSQDGSGPTSGDAEAEAMSDELRAEALDLLDQPDLLDDAAKAMDTLGLQGEVVNRRVAFLSAVSGHLNEPIHLVVHGASSGGKNMLIRTATRLLPERRVRFLGGMSAHALEYRGGRLEGVLVIEEAEGQKDAEYQLRIAMSEGKITRITVNRSEAGRNEAQDLEIEITASIFTTTTLPALHDENQTRVWDLWIDDSQELTRDILRAYARQAEGQSPDVTDELLAMWRAAMSLLEPAPVVLPFAGLFVDDFPTEQLRARRDYQRVIRLISASALLHQRQRQRDDQNRIIATTVDYGLVYPLLQAILGPSMIGLSEKALELCRLQKELEQTITANWVRRVDLQNEAAKRRVASQATVHKWAERLRELGIWEGDKDRGVWRHRTLRDPEQTPLPLPTQEELEQRLITKAETDDGPTQEGGSDV